MDEAVRYWLEESHKSQEALELGKTIGLDFPCGDPTGLKAGLMYSASRFPVANCPS
jgi:hypothetical protein